MRREALELAERAYDHVQVDPRRAHALAAEAAELAKRHDDVEALVAALHARGFAETRLGDPRALRTLRSAVRVGERSGQTRRAALARRNVAFQLAYRGRPTEAVRAIEAAHSALTGVERARTEVFRIAVYDLAGRLDEVLPQTGAALAVLRRRGDKLWEARLAYNRGAAWSELGEHGRALRDLGRARALFTELGLSAAVADAQIELARAHALGGDPLRCLEELNAVDEEALTSWAACWLYLNRAEALLDLRLLAEAQADLQRFADSAAQAGARDTVERARLQAARLALAAGDVAAAQALATAARRAAASRRQRSLAAVAALVVFDVATTVGPARRSLIRATRAAAVELHAQGRVGDALRAHLLLARAAATNGSIEVAQRELDASAALRRRGSLVDRIERFRVEALLQSRMGDRSGAERTLRRGLDLLERRRAELGSVELRTTASALAGRLAGDGLRLALDSERATGVLHWAELLRANALRLPAVRPPEDRSLRAAQAELRVLERRRNESDGRIAERTARQAELESVVRSRSRLSRGAGAPKPALPEIDTAARTLGRRALLEYVELDGRLFALTLAKGRLDLVELDAADAGDNLTWLRFALGRLAHGRLGAAQRAALLANATAAAAALDRSLIEPLLPALGDAPLVVVPTGALHALPWSALPSLRGRPVVVSPSLSQWLALTRRPRRRNAKTAVVAGPRLRHASAEAREIAAVHTDATLLRGRDATAEAVLAALDGASLAHVACHGRFRADSPLFSALELADGPLNALELQTLRRAPEVLVLSACDVALSERHAGDELLGLSAALLAMGTRTIVASVVPVPDRAARRLLAAFHRRLAAGAAPAVALARAQDAELAGFVCLGS